MGVVHHDIDEHGHEKAQDCRPIAHLIPVDPAVPGRAAVDELVAKDVEPVEDEAQDEDGVPRRQGSPEATLRGPASPTARAGSPPAFDRQTFERTKVAGVRRHEGQLVGMCDRGDLAVDERRCPADGGQPCTLPGVPVRRLEAVVQDRKAFQNHVLEVALDRLAPARAREPRATEPQFVPHRRRDRDLAFVLEQAAEDSGARSRAQRFGDGVGVEQILHRLQPHVAAGRYLTYIPEQVLGVECKLGKLESVCELPVRVAEAPPP